MKLKDLSLIFSAGVLAILFVVVNLLSTFFIEKGGLLIIGAVLVATYLMKFLLGVFL